MLEMPELGPGGREQLVDHAHVIVHRAADVEEEQDLDGVAPLGPRHHVEPALLGGGPDGAVEVELLGGAVSGPAAQAAQRDLDVAGSDFDRVVEVAKLALVPDLDGAAVAALVLADAHALGVVAVSAEGRGPGRADPLAPALVAALLLAEALAQGLHQLVEAAERLDLGALLLGQVFLGELAQPVLGDGGALQDRLGGEVGEAAEDPAEDAVETVDVALVLHQGGAREIVEPLGVVEHHLGVQRRKEGQVFAQARRDPGPAQLGEEPGEHQTRPSALAAMTARTAARVRTMPWIAA